MMLQRFDDVSQFYARVESFLLGREAEHNLMLGLCTTLMRTDTGQLAPYLAAVEESGAVVAVAMRTPPHNLILSEMAETRPLRLIAEDVYTLYGRELPGVLGPKSPSGAFADLWQTVAGCSGYLRLAERIYRLEQVRPVSGVSGQMQAASEANRALLVEWLMAFAAEALEPMPREEAEWMVGIRLGSDPRLRAYRVWYDGGRPVSFAGYAGPTPNGIRVAPVYTPPEYRRRGYASALVAAMSQALLDEGRKFCFLFTDLSNPTSNHIYQDVGYEPVSDVDEYRFEYQEQPHG